MDANRRRKQGNVSVRQIFNGEQAKASTYHDKNTMYLANSKCDKCADPPRCCLLKKIQALKQALKSMKDYSEPDAELLSYCEVSSPVFVLDDNDISTLLQDNGIESVGPHCHQAVHGEAAVLRFQHREHLSSTIQKTSRQ